jgi:dipeptidyl aminopeptidase/acylaminoacyl peptidase
VLPLLGLALHAALFAQWTHRYPKVEGFNHHVYLEGYELPVLNPGPSDPAISPDGSTIAISARGYLWLYDETSSRAHRLTRGRDLDSRPRWSPDGRSLVFVRDRGDETSIVQVDVSTGEERVLVDEPALDLDPVYSIDGTAVFYSSAKDGDLDLWRLDLVNGARTRLTEAAGLELSPIPVSTDELVYVAKVPGKRFRLDSRSEERDDACPGGGADRLPDAPRDPSRSASARRAAARSRRRGAVAPGSGRRASDPRSAGRGASSGADVRA